MSTATTTSRSTTARHEEAGRPPLGRLVGVELRKSVDTRTGRWLMIIIALASLGVAAGQVFGGDAQAGDLAFWLFFQQIPVGFLVPVLAILLLTSEWGARTGLGTFTLVPRRQRVLAAKLGAVLVLTVIAFVFSAAMTALGTALGAVVQDVPADWSLTWWQVVQPFVILLMNVLVGFALGLLLLNAAAAIVIFFIVPALVPLLFFLVSGLQDVGPWVDFSTALATFTAESMASGEQWLQIAVTSAIWVALPSVIGARRVQRSEIG